MAACGEKKADTPAADTAPRRAGARRAGARRAGARRAADGVAGRAGRVATASGSGGACRRARCPTPTASTRRAVVVDDTDASSEKREEMVMSSVRQTFNPEFINRLDEIIIFDQLIDPELLEVVQLQVDQINRTMSRHGFEVRLTPEAKRWIVEKTCADRSYGARPLRRALQKYVEDPLSEALIQGQLAGSPLVEVYLSGDELDFRPAGIETADDALLIH